MLTGYRERLSHIDDNGFPVFDRERDDREYRDRLVHIDENGFPVFEREEVYRQDPEASRIRPAGHVADVVVLAGLFYGMRWIFRGIRGLFTKAN